MANDEPEDNHPWWVRAIVVPLVVGAAVGAFSSYMTAQVTMARYDERLSEVETKVEKRPTQAESRAYTDGKINELLVPLTEVNSTTRAMADDIRELKTDIRRLENKND